ncbi:MAG: SseB family protein, partial [Actinomycetes bacterium]
MSSISTDVDHGQVDPELLELLLQDRLSSKQKLFEKLSSSRLIAAIMPKKQEQVEMVQALFVSNDGRQAMPVFSCLDELKSWNQEARPLPLNAIEFAQQTLTQGLDGLIIDIASEHKFVIDGYMLSCLANGKEWKYPHQDREVLDFIEGICLGLDGVKNVEIKQGQDCDLQVTIYGPNSIAQKVVEVS